MLTKRLLIAGASVLGLALSGPTAFAGAAQPIGATGIEKNAGAGGQVQLVHGGGGHGGGGGWHGGGGGWRGGGGRGWGGGWGFYFGGPAYYDDCDWGNGCGYPYYRYHRRYYRHW